MLQTCCFLNFHFVWRLNRSVEFEECVKIVEKCTLLLRMLRPGLTVLHHLLAVDDRSGLCVLRVPYSSFSVDLLCIRSLAVSFTSSKAISPGNSSLLNSSLSPICWCATRKLAVVDEAELDILVTVDDEKEASR